MQSHSLPACHFYPTILHTCRRIFWSRFPLGFQWFPLDSNRFPLASNWFLLVSVWFQVVFSGFYWFLLVSSWFLFSFHWFPLDSTGFHWIQTDFHCFHLDSICQFNNIEIVFNTIFPYLFPSSILTLTHKI